MATSYDYAPHLRSSVGFDRVFNLLENAHRTRAISDWPPYDLVKTDDDTYRISIAVADFTQDDLDITFQSDLLTVTDKKQDWLRCADEAKGIMRSCNRYRLRPSG